MKYLIIAILLIPTLCLAADYRAEMAVPFTGNGTRENCYRPDIDKYNITKFEDVTGTPGGNIIPAPNLYIILVESDNTTLDTMIADGVIELWRERLPDKS